jgi:type IV pilus assembly protein PilM
MVGICTVYSVHMTLSFFERAQAIFAPPRYLVPALSGIDFSTSSIKAVRLGRTSHGLVLAAYANVPLAAGVFTGGDVGDRTALTTGIKAAMSAARISTATAGLPESKSYIFETTVSGETKAQWCTGVEQHLEELVPLPPQMTTFDIVPAGTPDKKGVLVVGAGFARRVIEDILSVYDGAGLRVSAFEAENFAMTRALLAPHDQATVLIIDVGRSTTKICIASHGLPRFATTIGIGGHAITLAVQKYFGVTEEEAIKIKAEQGIAPALGNQECLGAMLSTIAAIRDEIGSRLDYWQAKATPGGAHEPVSRAILVGGNATLRGFQEYLESALRIPVSTGDVFVNFASRDTWLPPINYNESLAYATAIGLALHDQHSHE